MLLYTFRRELFDGTGDIVIGASMCFSSLFFSFLFLLIVISAAHFDNIFEMLRFCIVS
jgi:hypothetical protein